MSDFETILRAYEASGGDPHLLQSAEVASLVVSGNQVLGANELPGIRMTYQPLADGIAAQVVVAPGTHIERPVHLCFGVVARTGVQRIVSHFEIGAGASVAFVAHCTFPNAEQVDHIMQSDVQVGEHASMRYNETHFHGESGGTRTYPTSHVTVAEGGRYASEFGLSTGRAGLVDLDFAVDVAADGVAELSAKVMGYGDDDITVKETIRLNGAGARGLAKSRIAVRERARSQVLSTTEGNAPFTKGHVDCVEIVRDQATASAVPVVRVTDPRAQVTHEAAIGTVDKKELETLMARGLDEESAVDVIVRGMLGE